MSRFVGIKHPPDTLPLGISLLKTSACPPGPPRPCRLIESKKISDVRAFRFCWAFHRRHIPLLQIQLPSSHAGMARFLSRGWVNCGELPVPSLVSRDSAGIGTRLDRPSLAPRPTKRAHPIALLDLDCQLYVVFHFLIRVPFSFFSI